MTPHQRWHFLGVLGAHWLLNYWISTFVSLGTFRSVVLGLRSGQIILVAAWIVLVYPTKPLRVVWALLALSVALLMLVWGGVYPVFYQRLMPQIAASTIITSVMAVFLLATARIWRGWRIQLPNGTDYIERRFQFTLRHIMMATALLAMALGTARLFYEPTKMLTMPFFNVLSCMPVIAVPFYTRRSVTRAILIVVAIFAYAYLSGFVSRIWLTTYSWSYYGQAVFRERLWNYYFVSVLRHDFVAFSLQYFAIASTLAYLRWVGFHLKIEPRTAKSLSAGTPGRLPP